MWLLAEHTGHATPSRSMTGSIRCTAPAVRRVRAESDAMHFDERFGAMKVIISKPTRLLRRIFPEHCTKKDEP
jgi:hypothetical protein